MILKVRRGIGEDASGKHHLPVIMSDMRKAYNQIYNIYTISEKPPEQQQFFFSGEETKSSSMQEKKSEDSRPASNQGKRKQSIYTPKAGRIPFILPPPKTEAMQVKRLKQEQTEMAEPKLVELRSFPEKEKNNVVKRASPRIPDSLKKMLSPFSPMLSWSPSLPSKYSNSLSYKTEKLDDRRKMNEVDPQQNLETDLTKNSITEPVHEEETSNIHNDDLYSGEPAESLEKMVNEFTAELQDVLEPIMDQDDCEDEIPEQMDSSDLESQFTLLLEDDAILNQESLDDDFQISESPALIQNPSSDLEEEYISLLEESSSDSSSSFSRQDEVFSLIAETIEESSIDLKESSTVHEESSIVPDESSMVHEEPVSKIEYESSYHEQNDGESESTFTNVMDLSEESSSYAGEFSNLLKKAWCMLEESTAGHSCFQNQILEMVEESSSLNEFTRMFKEAHQTESELEKDEKYQKISMLLEEFSAMLLGNASRPISESNDLTDKFTIELESSDKNEVCEESTSCQLEESSIPCMEEENNDLSLHGNCPEPSCTGPIVKVPVLIAKSNVEINIFEFLPVGVPAECVTKMEWSVESLRCHTILPTNTAFVKGIITAEIQFVMNDKIHIKTSSLPIEKTINLEWISNPEMPKPKAKSEFMFQTEHSRDIHYEFFQEFTEDINCQLKSVHVVWHHERAEKDDKAFEIKGEAVLCVDFLQEQYVILKC